MEEAKNEGDPKSQYPDGYENVPLGSDMSYYLPIVGEINYVQAVLPQRPEPIAVEVKKSSKLVKQIGNEHQQSNLIDIIPANEEEIKESSIKHKKSNEPIAPPSHLQPQPGSQNVSALIDEQNILNAADRAQQQQIRGRQHELAPKMQRDHTENAREEEKKEDVTPPIVVQPSSLLQQIQRDIISFDKGPQQQNGNQMNELLKNLNQSYQNKNKEKCVGDQKNIINLAEAANEEEKEGDGDHDNQINKNQSKKLEISKGVIPKHMQQMVRSKLD